MARALCKTMKTIEIVEKYETTHVDSDALLAQSETKEGVGVIIAVVFNGEVRRLETRLV